MEPHVYTAVVSASDDVSTKLSNSDSILVGAISIIIIVVLIAIPIIAEIIETRPRR